jgi:hypothetical protein
MWEGEGMAFNAVPFIELVEEHTPEKISKEWVLWALKIINAAEANRLTVNPDWVKPSINAGRCTTGKDEPAWD